MGVVEVAQQSAWSLGCPTPVCLTRCGIEELLFIFMCCSGLIHLLVQSCWYAEGRVGSTGPTLAAALCVTPAQSAVALDDSSLSVLPQPLLQCLLAHMGDGWRKDAEFRSLMWSLGIGENKIRFLLCHRRAAKAISYLCLGGQPCEMGKQHCVA